jgi:Tfp pilus assembly protein PilN
MSKVQTMPLEIWTDINGNAARTQFKGGTKYIRADAQATVESLQRELEHAKKMEAVQKEVADNQTWHVQKLRTLIAALPKVEGQFEVGSGACYYVRALDGKSNPIICGLMTEQAVAYAILALLKHRQGMEG